MKLLAALITLSLTGCAGVDAIQSTVAHQGAAISDEARQTAEFVLCKGISVGAWRRAYGDSPDKAAAWRSLCSETVGQTP